MIGIICLDHKKRIVKWKKQMWITRRAIYKVTVAHLAKQPETHSRWFNIWKIFMRRESFLPLAF
jgi:hypothetical protein